ncbi:MAG: L-2-hydroxyglutarate oxidase [Bifidobacteriaceae bacterium]|nr:L-2-hydroxyglutarate oxidase [Bifidobacteriaceae bacterium]
MNRTDIAVVGAGIVGLAVAEALSRQGRHVTVLEKEPTMAAHQTGRNSGVIHSGIYYAPGSLKARLCRAGAASMARFAEEHGVARGPSGKVIVATRPSELPALRALAARAGANGIEAHQVTRAQVAELEPHVGAIAGLHLPGTGTIDYSQVCQALGALVVSQGGEVLLGQRLVAARTVGETVEISLADGSRLAANGLINCGGLHSDEICSACGVDPGVRIVPFRGEYYELAPDRRDLVRSLVYPVPDPRFPFLGVHLTRMVDGSVHAGPNAVLALAREGYTWRDIQLDDLAGTLTWPGFWRLAARYAPAGAKEMARSASMRLFAASLVRLVPEIEPSDLRPAPAGIRAQALTATGALVDDFLIRRAPRQIHVLNAPSPAATAALEIAHHLSTQSPT